MLVLDENGIVKFANLTAGKLLNREHALLAGEYLGTLIAEKDTTEIQIILPDFKTREVEFRVSDLIWRGRPASIVALRDTTERKQAEENLKKSESELRKAQRLAQIGSWTYDPVTQQPTWSEQMFDIWGLDPEPGAPVYSEHIKYIHPDD